MWPSSAWSSRGTSGPRSGCASWASVSVLPADAEPEVIARALREAVAGTSAPGPGRRRPAGRPAACWARRPTRRTGPPGAAGVVAVWGPTGAPGRTTVAVGLADEAARLGISTLLVDADVYGGVVAQVLGLLDESPGLAGAARLAATGSLDAAAPGPAGVGGAPAPARADRAGPRRPLARAAAAGGGRGARGGAPAGRR